MIVCVINCVLCMILSVCIENRESRTFLSVQREPRVLKWYHILIAVSISCSVSCYHLPSFIVPVFMPSVCPRVSSLCTRFYAISLPLCISTLYPFLCPQFAPVYLHFVPVFYAISLLPGMYLVSLQTLDCPQFFVCLLQRPQRG